MSRFPLGFGVTGAISLYCRDMSKNKVKNLVFIYSTLDPTESTQDSPSSLNKKKRLKKILLGYHGTILAGKATTD